MQRMVRCRSEPAGVGRARAQAQRGGDRPFVDIFLGKHYEDVACKKSKAATHLKLTGGKYCIPADKETRFLLEYAKDIEGGSARHCFTEVMTPTFPFFVDLDVFLPEMSPSEVDGLELALEWSRAAIGGIAPCVDDAAPREASLPLDPLFAASCDVVRTALAARDRMLVSTSLVLLAPPRGIVKGGVSGTKVGVHVLWPGLLCAKPAAQRLREIVVTALHEHCKGINWDEAVDLAVYREMSSLRMIGSYKPRECSECTEEHRQATRRQEKAARQTAAQLFSLDPATATSNQVAMYAAASLQPQSAGRVRATMLTEHAAAKVREYCRLRHATMRCPECAGRGKIADESVGVYAPVAVLLSDGDRDGDLEGLLGRDVGVAVHVCSVRRSHGESPVQIAWPRHAPAAQPVTFAEVPEAANEDEDFIPPLPPPIQTGSVIPEERRLVKVPIDDREIMDAAEAFLRSGAVGQQYQATPPEAAESDGSPFYTVIATVRGYGAHYCQAFRGDHSVNFVYFEFRPDRTVVQKCRSSKRQGCQRACCPAVEVDAFLYTSLFPCSSLSLQVLDEEVQGWTSGRLPNSYLTKFKIGKKVFTYCTRDDGGAKFRSFVSLGRRAFAREARLRRESGDASATLLGKRDADQPGEYRRPSSAGPDVDDGEEEWELNMDSLVQQHPHATSRNHQPTAPSSGIVAGPREGESRRAKQSVASSGARVDTFAATVERYVALDDELQDLQVKSREMKAEQGKLGASILEAMLEKGYDKCQTATVNLSVRPATRQQTKISMFSPNGTRGTPAVCRASLFSGGLATAAYHSSGGNAISPSFIVPRVLPLSGLATAAYHSSGGNAISPSFIVPRVLPLSGPAKAAYFSSGGNAISPSFIVPRVGPRRLLTTRVAETAISPSWTRGTSAVCRASHF
ncbi:hypothetical protein JKP88DRAFT_273038 [Tribonema minus]|uniref:C962R-like N-terminal AEP domain-containing protein n=1 Tax=Tribonema minus TaxID=303371 RepID=A0A835YZW5_9STRA|nr:hypothetical protein JKP88DRAFT_273038 [Tribonema minus]